MDCIGVFKGLEELCELARKTEDRNIWNTITNKNLADFKRYVDSVMVQKIEERYKDIIIKEYFFKRYYDEIYINLLRNPNFVLDDKKLDEYLNDKGAYSYILNLAQYTGSKKTQCSLADKNNELINLALAGNENLFEEVSANLGKTENDSVLIRLTRNRKLSEVGFSSIMSKPITARVAIAILISPNATLSVYSELLSRDFKGNDIVKIKCTPFRNDEFETHPEKMKPWIEGMWGISEPYPDLYSPFTKLVPYSITEYYIAEVELALMRKYSKLEVLLTFNAIKHFYYTGRESYLTKLLLADFSDNIGFLNEIYRWTDEWPKIYYGSSRWTMLRDLIKLRRIDSGKNFYTGFNEYFKALFNLSNLQGFPNFTSEYFKEKILPKQCLLIKKPK